MDVLRLAREEGGEEGTSRARHNSRMADCPQGHHCKERVIASGSHGGCSGESIGENSSRQQPKVYSPLTVPGPRWWIRNVVTAAAIIGFGGVPSRSGLPFSGSCAGPEHNTSQFLGCSPLGLPRLTNYQPCVMDLPAMASCEQTGSTVMQARAGQLAAELTKCLSEINQKLLRRRVSKLKETLGNLQHIFGERVAVHAQPACGSGDVHSAPNYHSTRKSKYLERLLWTTTASKKKWTKCAHGAKDCQAWYWPIDTAGRGAMVAMEVV
ncbi:hypothetical protein BJV78DRAFT_1156826 [Lactifluus subvellereus]|nr:hypothetical protein BJV78DRAFT_1156826 [Lactifluus subvellereus]